MQLRNNMVVTIARYTTPVGFGENRWHPPQPRGIVQKSRWSTTMTLSVCVSRWPNALLVTDTTFPTTFPTKALANPSLTLSSILLKCLQGTPIYVKKPRKKNKQKIAFVR